VKVEEVLCCCLHCYPSTAISVAVVYDLVGDDDITPGTTWLVYVPKLPTTSTTCTGEL
jgi:hypothetical protein